jgi:putative membrane protein insertion efficiency factor
MKDLLLSAIRWYQRWVSPLLGPVCRFEPSCSRYAAAVIGSHGALRGSLLSALRLCKCHPLHPGGYDPPPLPARSSSASANALPDHVPAPGRISKEV